MVAIAESVLQWSLAPVQEFTTRRTSAPFVVGYDEDEEKDFDLEEEDDFGDEEFGDEDGFGEDEEATKTATDPDKEPAESEEELGDDDDASDSTEELLPNSKLEGKVFLAE